MFIMNERGYGSLFIEGSLAAFVENTQPCILRVVNNIRLDNEDLPPSPKNTATGNNIYSANTPRNVLKQVLLTHKIYAQSRR